MARVTYGVIRVGPLTLNRLERRATLDGQAVELTPREFSLLTYLAQQSNRVVSRTELLRHVWDTTFDPGSNVVNAHIKKVREKLGKFAARNRNGQGCRLSSGV